MEQPVTVDESDPRGEVVRLEARMEELESTLESCRKFILASRIAVAAGGILLAAIVFGAIRFDPGVMAGGIAALLGGIVVWGSNGSTAKEAAAELTDAEGRRASLIELLDLHPIAERKWLH
jgi:hypothetical protein